ncbi:MAG: hypothetical protein WBE99_03925 [Xanthobacteraceae bacterium]
MIKNIVGDLRAIAERCARFSRDCKKHELARALDDIELMTKASELEREFDT